LPKSTSETLVSPGNRANALIPVAVASVAWKLNVGVEGVTMKVVESTRRTSAGSAKVPDGSALVVRKPSPAVNW
jgi:hypothetical protein